MAQAPPVVTGKLKGEAPDTFTGDCTESEAFKQQFQVYWYMRRTPLELIPPPCPIFPCLHTPLHLPPSRSLESFSLPSMLVKLYYKVNHTSLKH
jgi:hypothetical protein